MSAVHSTPGAAAKPQQTLTGVIVAAGAIIAVTIVILFILSTSGGGSHNSTRAAVGNTPPYHPLIQYRGTGAPPAFAVGMRHDTPASNSTHKSYGAVP